MKLWRCCGWLLLILSLVGCQKTAHWYGTDITGLMPNLAFELTGMDGKPLAQEAFAGKSLLLFFGYTSCPDVCPATLMRLAQARAALPDAMQQRVAILFVSVDPKRDTPERLAQYTHYFGKGIIGATGTKAQLDAITSRYRTSYSYGKPDASGNYVVNHGSGIYGFDSQGKIRLLIMDDNSVPHLTADMQQLAGL
jgi:protein SCO1/2